LPLSAAWSIPAAFSREGLEQFCERGFNATYNSVDKVIGGSTFGGYSNAILVDEAFVLRISDKLDLAGVAPLLCAGITSPCAIGGSDRARRSVLPGSAGSATWA
jgi:D-arabinose 1-dehydrogenase-like Zn-dependent alcohol dehydrogenase